MYTMRVREATVADLERVAEIKVANWADTYGEILDAETLAPFLDANAQLAYIREVFAAPDSLLLVAEENGRVVGFALTYIDREPEPWMESLHVVREFRSRGAGRLLMRSTAEELRARAYRTLRLGVVEGNDAAARFYEGLGAVRAGREPASWAPHVWHELYRWPDLERLTLPGG
jgi:ribosomal protein S18 acetylase RimI-like enzyme